MPKRNPLFWLSCLLALLFLLALAVWWRWRRLWHSVSVPKNDLTAPVDLERLYAENQMLNAENQRLRERVSDLEGKLASQSKLDLVSLLSWARLRILLPRALLTLAGLALVLSPVYLVFQERWLNTPGVRDSMMASWCRVDFLCKTALPSYFLVVFACFGAVLALFLTVAPDRRAIFQSAYPLEAGEWAAPQIGPRQLHLSRAFLILSGLLAAVSVTLGAWLNRLPGVELLLGILLYFAGRLLQDRPLQTIYRSVRRVPSWFLPLLLTTASLTLFLRSLVVDHTLSWLYVLLLAIGLIYLFPFSLPRLSSGAQGATGSEGRRLSPIFWLVLLAIILYTIRLDSWQFAIVGDEFDFFNYGRDIVHNQSLWRVLEQFFRGQAVYGAHPYFSSLVQAAFMKVLGVDNFGWRFSNIFLSAIALLFFYDFFRTFLSERIALVATALLAGSHYLMTFGKIGYNNLQAYFVMGLLLWVTGKAVRSRRPLAYSGLGLAMGLCFYVYPAALYLLPLPPLLLLFYDPPLSRPALRRWLLMAIGLEFLILPLLFQPGYWTAKIPGTMLYNPSQMEQSGPGFHIISNVIYALFSYLYTPEESHFVVAAHIDPLSALFVPVGIAWLIQLFRREKFARFSVLAFVMLLFLVGASHDRSFPANTRMFLLLPWWALLAASGLVWCTEQVRSWGLLDFQANALLFLVLLAIYGANLYQAYSLTRQRTLGTPDLEKLYLRLVQREERLRPNSSVIYLFITQEDWGIDGIRTLRDVYNVPRSQAQLDRIVVETPELPQALIQRMADDRTLVIPQPWMDEQLLGAVEDGLRLVGKQPCPIRDTPRFPARFTLWLPADKMEICPGNQEW